MNKIIIALLETKFPGVNTNALMEVILATTDAEVATEILCGLYEQPDISIIPRMDKLSENKAEVKFLYYDKFNKTVHYSYKNLKSKSIWNLKGTDLPLYADINEVQSTYYMSELAKKLGITEEEGNKLYERKTVYGEAEKNSHNNSCTISEWQPIEYSSND